VPVAVADAEPSEESVPYVSIILPCYNEEGHVTVEVERICAARGQIFAWTDADMTYPNEQIPGFVQLLEKDETIDQVVGARTTEQGTYKMFRVPAK